MDIVFAVLVAAVVTAYIGWLLSRLSGRLRAERARQEPEARTPLLSLGAAAALIVVVAIWMLGDARAGFRVGMTGLLVVGLAESVRRWLTRRRTDGD